MINVMQRQTSKHAVTAPAGGSTMPGARSARLVMTIVAIVVIAGMLAAMMASAVTVAPG